MTRDQLFAAAVAECPVLRRLCLWNVYHLSDREIAKRVGAMMFTGMMGDVGGLKEDEVAFYKRVCAEVGRESPLVTIQQCGTWPMFMLRSPAE